MPQDVRVTRLGQRKPAVIARAALSLLLVALGTEGAIAAGPFKYRASVRSTYTSNPFHYSDRQLNEFNAGRGTGERFQDLDSKTDIVNRLRFEAIYGKDLGSKRDLDLRFGVERHIHFENGIADFTQLGLDLQLEATRKDSFRFEIEHVPDRFKKNYLFRRSGTTNIFDAAFLEQTDLIIGYDRQIRKRWSARIAFHNRDRSYDPKFSDRDLDGDYLELRTKYRIRKGLHGKTELDVGEGTTGIGKDLGAQIDRSYDQLALSQQVDLAIGKGHDLIFGLQYREKEFTTSVRQDLARFDRVDDRLKAWVEGEHEIRKRLSFLWRIVTMDNDSDSKDPTAEADELGYDELEVGAGLEVRF